MSSCRGGQSRPDLFRSAVAQCVLAFPPQEKKNAQWWRQYSSCERGRRQNFKMTVWSVTSRKRKKQQIKLISPAVTTHFFINIYLQETWVCRDTEDLKLTRNLHKNMMEALLLWVTWWDSQDVATLLLDYATTNTDSTRWHRKYLAGWRETALSRFEIKENALNHSTVQCNVHF